jgi:hypothetical protein
MPKVTIPGLRRFVGEGEVLLKPAGQAADDERDATATDDHPDRVEHEDAARFGKQLCAPGVKYSATVQPRGPLKML